MNQSLKTFLIQEILLYFLTLFRINYLDKFPQTSSMCQRPLYSPCSWFMPHSDFWKQIGLFWIKIIYIQIADSFLRLTLKNPLVWVSLISSLLLPIWPPWQSLSVSVAGPSSSLGCTSQCWTVPGFAPQALYHPYLFWSLGDTIS